MAGVCVLRNFEENQQAIKKPSLLSGSGDTAAVNSRILSALEHGGGKGFSARRPPVGRRSVGVIGLLSILGVGAAIIVYQYQNTAPPIQHVSPLAGSSPTNVIAKKPESIPPPPTFETEPQGLTALIVNEPVAASGNPSAVSAPHSVLGSANPPLVVNPREARVLPSGASTKTHAAPPALASARHPGPGNNISPVTSTDTEKQGVVAAKGQTKDRDVALLEALIAHAAEQPVRASESPKKSAKNTPPPASATLAKTGENSRDFVERKPGDSTESLLVRCKQLGFFEGGLCRWRMCSGRWDTDAACKVTQESQ